MRLFFMVPTVFALGLLPLAAQQIGTNATPGKADSYTLQVKSQLVVETVVVTDKKGNAIPGLTAEDFSTLR